MREGSGKNDGAAGLADVAGEEVVGGGGFDGGRGELSELKEVAAVERELEDLPGFDDGADGARRCIDLAEAVRKDLDRCAQIAEVKGDVHGSALAERDDDIERPRGIEAGFGNLDIVGPGVERDELISSIRIGLCFAGEPAGGVGEKDARLGDRASTGIENGAGDGGGAKGSLGRRAGSGEDAKEKKASRETGAGRRRRR
jgi:hypothetical protein